MEGVKCSIKVIEKSLENAWATIEDVQEDFKTHKDSKKTHQEMLDCQSREIKLLKEELAKSQAETAPLKTSQQRTQESLVTLEDYARRENLRFMNIPEEADENCSDKVYDIIENELKINPQDIRFHAVHRVGKPPSRNSENNTSPRPRSIIARFAVREDRDAVFAIKNRLKHSQCYKDVYITMDCARVIQEERKTLIQAMYVAKERGCDARKLLIEPSTSTKKLSMLPTFHTIFVPPPLNFHQQKIMVASVQPSTWNPLWLFPDTDQGFIVV